MKLGIVVVTSKATERFLSDFVYQMSSMNVKYPVYYHMNSEETNEYEIGGIKRGMELYDEFVLLHDTCIVKTASLFNLFFHYKNRSVSVSPNFLSYLGKFRTETLSKMELPFVRSKKDAVDAESQFLREYISHEPNHVVLFPDFDNNYTWKTHNGRMNMVLENQYLIKYKGCWHPDMILN